MPVYRSSGARLEFVLKTKNRLAAVFHTQLDYMLKFSVVTKETGLSEWQNKNRH